MVEQLRKILEDGVAEALRQESQNINQSFVLKGKSDAFREVLLVIDQLEKKDGSEDSVDQEDKTEK